MNPQEIFDTVVKHLREQGGPAHDNESCAYRAPDGRKCAVGCLIPDYLYHKSMEGLNLNQLMSKSSFRLPAFFKGEKNRALMKNLQEVHDFEFNDEQGFGGIVSSLVELAKDFNLNDAEVFKS